MCSMWPETFECLYGEKNGKSAYSKLYAKILKAVFKWLDYMDSKRKIQSGMVVLSFEDDRYRTMYQSCADVGLFISLWNIGAKQPKKKTPNISFYLYS